MAYLRISDDAMDHPKLSQLTDGAHRLWFNANCWCQKHLTNGHIPATSLRDIPRFKPRYVRDLIAAGLWHSENGTYIVHDFLVHNDSKDQVLDRRRRKAGRMANWRERRRDMLSVDAPQDAPQAVLLDGPRATPRASSVSSPSPHLTSPHLSDPKNGSHTTARPAALAAGFDAFWLTYPRKAGKGAARKVWARLKPGDELVATIIEAVGRQRNSPQWTKDGGQFIPHPATWLSQERWTDETLLQRAARINGIEQQPDYRTAEYECRHTPKCDSARIHQNALDMGRPEA
jgi:hypothetical protein